jgi:hypothetical protein
MKVIEQTCALAIRITLIAEDFGEKLTEAEIQLYIVAGNWQI